MNQQWREDDPGHQDYEDSSRRFRGSPDFDNSRRDSSPINYQHRRGSSNRSFSSWSNDDSDKNSTLRSYGSSLESNSVSNRSSFHSNEQDRRPSPQKIRTNGRTANPKKIISRILVFIFGSGFLFFGVFIYRRYIADILFNTEKDSSKSPAPGPKPDHGMPSVTDTPSLEPSILISIPSSMPILGVVPSIAPSKYSNTFTPSMVPSVEMSESPTVSFEPTTKHSERPSGYPSSLPSFSIQPSAKPTIQVSETPSSSHIPSFVPSHVPSILPSLSPSEGPLKLIITEIGDPYGTPQYYPFIELYSPNRQNYVIEEEITLIHWQTFQSSPSSGYINLKGKTINQNGFIVFCIMNWKWGASCDYNINYGGILTKGANYLYALVQGTGPTAYSETIDIFGTPGAWDSTLDYKNGRAVRTFSATEPRSIWNASEWTVAPGGECYQPILTNGCDPGEWKSEVPLQSSC